MTLNGNGEKNRRVVFLFLSFTNIFKKGKKENIFYGLLRCEYIIYTMFLLHFYIRNLHRPAKKFSSPRYILLCFFFLLHKRKKERKKLYVCKENGIIHGGAAAHLLPTVFIYVGFLRSSSSSPFFMSIKPSSLYNIICIPVLLLLGCSIS